MKLTCKKCRRLGQSVCGRDNCAIKRKPYPPGPRGKRRKRISEFGYQLIEKQKIKLIYGVREKQFRKYFAQASKKKGRTGQELLSLLERRLDNVVFRLGLATNRTQARQMVGHGHFKVNSRKITIPSYKVEVGDEITIREGSREKDIFKELDIRLKKYDTPVWLELNKKTFSGKMKAEPSKEDLADIPVEVAQVVEFYSR